MFSVFINIYTMILFMFRYSIRKKRHATFSNMTIHVSKLSFTFVTNMSDVKDIFVIAVVEIHILIIHTAHKVSVSYSILE